MDARVTEPRARRFDLPSRGGVMAALEYGPADRPVDVVFSHANGFNARAYRTILAPLGDELRVLSLDLRGHGASTLPAEVEGWPGWEEYADDLLAVLAQASDRPVVLAGHSLGATSSLLAAARAPGKARALVLFDPVLIAPAEHLRTPFWDFAPAQVAARRRDRYPDRAAALEAYRGRGAFRTWSEAQLADYVAAGFQDTADGDVRLACRPAWEAANFAVHGYDPWRALEQVQAPVRILAAEQESTADRKLLRPLIDGGHATLEVVPGTTHFLPMERPEVVREALRAAARG
jgi:pimeloyl-ACP methyl ester carboxylesterase